MFKARGYHGTSVRALAKVVGIEAASLYHHFASKQKILFDIFNRAMEDLGDGLERALSGTTSHEERLRAAVRFHVIFHIERQDEAFISHSELRSLTAPNRRQIIARRDAYEVRLRAFLEAGKKAGVFEMADVRLTTIAILTMCSGVSDWFSKPGRLRAGAVADAYADMALRLLRNSADARSAHPPFARKQSSVTKPRAAQRRKRPPRRVRQTQE